MPQKKRKQNKKNEKISLKQIYKELQTIKREQRKISKFEEQQVKREKNISEQETDEIEELKALKEAQQKLTKAIGTHPLRRVTYRDVAKGAIGAFIGTTAHYSFIYGVKVAHQLDLTRAILLFPLAFAIGGVFLYITGFRKIKSTQLLWFLPVRLTALFITSLAVSFFVLYLLHPTFLHQPIEMFKTLATVQLSAIIGACTADLIGKEE